MAAHPALAARPRRTAFVLGILALLAIAVAVVAALLGWDRGTVTRVAADTTPVPAAGLDWSISIAEGGGCDTKGGDAKCAIGFGSKFTLVVSLNSLPDKITEYNRFDVFVTFTGVTLNPPANWAVTVVWPDSAYPATFSDPEDGGPGGAGAADVSADLSTHTGPMVEIAFNCTEEESAGNTISLVHGVTDTEVGLNWVGYAEGEGTTETLTVNCLPVTPTPTITPTPTFNPNPQMSLGVTGDDVECDNPSSPRKCTARYSAGNEKAAQFTLTVNASTIPTPDGYGGFQSEVLLDDGLKWNRSAACTDEVVWPHLADATCERSGAGQQAWHAGSTGSAVAADNSDHVGTLVELDVHCSEVGSFQARLTAFPDRIHGAAYLHENGEPVLVKPLDWPDVDVLTINCGATPTVVVVGGISVDPEQGGLPLETPASSRNSAGVLAGVIAGATAGALALGGAAWHARRRWLG